MFSFSTEQIVYELNDVKCGGQPGEHPTVLFGTLFYGDQFKNFGEAEKARAEVLIRKQSDMSDLMGNPGIIDIFIDQESVIREHIEFVLDNIDEYSPFAVDVPEASVRIATLKYLEEAGLLDRTIYNSLNLGITKEELDTLQNATPKGAILLGYNPKDFSADGRVEIIESGGGMLDRGIMAMADEAGIEVKLLDTAAVPFGHNAAETIRAIPVMKNKWGMPVGCSFHNTVESWQWLQGYREQRKEKDAYRICDIGSNGLVVSFGGSFVLYGPIENAPLVFPYVAMVDKIMSEGAEDYFGVLPAKGHPRLKLQ